MQLPEADEHKTKARLLQRFPAADACAPPPYVQDAITRITAVLTGKDVDLAEIRLDMNSVRPFVREVYAIARTIRPGATLTYGEIAARLGQRGSARAVGQALGANPFPLVVPCHRVVAAGGKLGGFSARGGARTKLRLLDIERVHARGGPTLFDDPAPARSA